MQKSKKINMYVHDHTIKIGLDKTMKLLKKISMNDLTHLTTCPQGANHFRYGSVDGKGSQITYCFMIHNDKIVRPN